MNEALIVDDVAFNRRLFGMALKTAGFNITEASDGQTALGILAHRTFAVLILDLQMPGIDGRAVLEWIRHQHQHDDMCVIVVTANPHMATVEVEALSDLILYKPIDVRQFVELAHRLVNWRAEPNPIATSPRQAPLAS